MVRGELVEIDYLMVQSRGECLLVVPQRRMLAHKVKPPSTC